MNRDQALEKVRKLLRLTKSDNVHEAALAAARAQEILDRYKLSADGLNLDGQPEEVDEEIRGFEAPLDGEVTGKLATWNARLAMIVAKANQCFVWRNGGALKIVGGASDADAVRYLYAFLKAEIERLAHRDARGNGRTWANNFRLGCVETIAAKLSEQRQATIQQVKSETSAIVLVEQKLAKLDARTKAVSDFAHKAFNLRSASRSQSSYDHGAREAGRRAAQEINIGGKGRLGAGVRGALGAG